MDRIHGPKLTLGVSKVDSSCLYLPLSKCLEAYPNVRGSMANLRLLIGTGLVFLSIIGPKGTEVGLLISCVLMVAGFFILTVNGILAVKN